MALSPEIRILPTAQDLFQSAANEFGTLAAEAVRNRGRFSVALSGGSTPKALYSLLAKGAVPSIPWDQVCFFWSDERHVPPDHPDSNYRMANESLLSKIPLRPESVFRVPAEEKDGAAAAKAYEQTVRDFFKLQPGEFPRFDLILLGTGPDGHTASLFPGSAGLAENKRLVISNWVEKFKTDRITFTYPVLNHAACVMFLLSGAEKASIAHELLEDPAAKLPAQSVCPIGGRLLWLLDSAAAAGLQRRSA